LTADSAAKFLLIVQWELAGILFSKVGLDQLVFARTAHDPALPINVKPAIQRYVVSVAAIFSVMIAQLFSYLTGFLCFLCIVFDVISVISAANLNARRKHMKAAFGALFNYPLFFFALWLLSRSSEVTEAIALGAFCASSAARAAYFYWASNELFHNRSSELRPTSAVVFQPPLNLLMFRADQLLLPALALWWPLQFSPSFVPEYVFLGKLPELLGGLFVQAGLVAFPRLHLSPPLTLRSGVALSRRHARWLFAGLAVIGAAALVYPSLYALQEIHLWAVLPFAVQALLIFPTNLQTFAMMQYAATRQLAANIWIALFAGVFWLAVVVASDEPAALAWLVPIQLSVFIARGFLIRWITDAGQKHAG
jgi:hypothetical protein